MSNNISVDEFKELLDFNKITHAEAERMKAKRSGKDLPFIKIKSDDPKQAEALFSGGGETSMPKNRHNFQGRAV